MSKGRELAGGSILYEVDGAVATAVLNRPERLNAIDVPMWDALVEVAQLVNEDDAVRCLVMTGAGRAFSSGADLSGSESDAPRRHAVHQMRRIGEAALAVHGIAKPVISKVNGVAAGAAANLALAADLVVASEDARFIQIFARRGLSVDFGGSWLLPRLVGLHRAKELALLAEPLSAVDAERMGLVNRVVARDELDSFVLGWASALASGPPIALASTKRLLDAGLDSALDRALEAETMAQVVNFGTEDTAEALAAFLERREPVFRGR